MNGHGHGSDNERRGTARYWAAALGLYTLAGGLVSFAAWPLDWPRLANWTNGTISTQPNAALAAACAGLALLLFIGGYRRLVALLGALLAFVGISVLFEFASGIDLGIDRLFLYGRSWGRVAVVTPGRMGPPGATSWALIGIALIFAARSPRFPRRRGALVPGLAMAPLAIATLSLIGYLYGASTLYTIPALTAIALQTATFIFAVSLGIVLSIEGHGPARLLRDPGPAGALIRRVLPTLIGIPLILGFVRLSGERTGLYDPAFGAAARTLVEMALLISLVWWAAAAVARQNRRQQAAEAALERSRLALEADLADSQRLQRLSAEIIHENDVQSLYEQVLDVAADVMRAQCASLQVLDLSRDQLKLLTSRGFTPAAAKAWEWVDASPASVCGVVLARGTRVVVPDVLTEAGSLDLAVFKETNIRAVQSTPLVSRSGQLVGVLSTHWNAPHTPSERDLRLLDMLARQAADLIERREAERNLLDADKRKDEFIATLAHELRNPLAPIRSAVDLMKIKATLNPELTWARDVIDRQVRLMSRLLDDLLDVSRITRDQLELRPERLELRAVIDAAVEVCRPLMNRYNHHLVVDLPNEPVFVEGDPARLGQVFGNLLNNACKYTPPAGSIWLSAKRRAEEVVISVRDTGIGIPTEQLATVFDLFSQVDPRIDHAHGGLGIGLYLVKRIVERHGGTIEARSNGRGQGSEFVVRMPAIAVAHGGAAQDAPREASVVPQAAALRILIVDDNVDAAASLAALLAIQGNETHVAHHGQGGVESAEALRPDVILLDIGLPDLNGFEVCRLIRQQPWAAEVVIIALTGWGQEVDRRRSAEAGVDHHLVKPVEHDTLTALLATLVPKRVGQ